MYEGRKIFNYEAERRWNCIRRTLKSHEINKQNHNQKKYLPNPNKSKRKIYLQGKPWYWENLPAERRVHRGRKDRNQDRENIDKFPK